MMRQLLIKIHRRLLSGAEDLGYTPYLWLLYLLFLLPGIIFLNTNPRSYILTGISIVIFLPFYFKSYSLLYSAQKQLLNSLGILLIGTGLLPFNFSAGVYFIYATAALGYTMPAKQSIWLIVVYTLVLVFESVLLNFPWYAIVMPALMAVIIGLANRHGYIVMQQNRALQISQQEVSRLAKMAERERIGRDLHDLLGHSLSLIALKAELAGKLLERNSTRAASEISDLETIARDALREVREAVSGYRKAGLRDEMVQAIQSLKSANISSHQSGDINTFCERLPDKTEVDLAMCLREVITNIIRHSNAQQCYIEWCSSDIQSRINIRDDGCGIPSIQGKKQLPKTASGLLGIQQRLIAMGGHLLLESNQNDIRGGTTVSLVLEHGFENENQHMKSENDINSHSEMLSANLPKGVKI